MVRIEAVIAGERIAATSPSVTVVTPTLNQADYIVDTIRWVAGQEGVEIEHIIVGGGSTDGTLGMLEQMEHKFRFEWISEPDRGKADAINKGFRRSSGEILAWLNSDDVYLRNDAVHVAVDYLQQFPGVTSSAAQGCI